MRKFCQVGITFNISITAKVLYFRTSKIRRKFFQAVAHAFLIAEKVLIITEKVLN